MTSRTGDAEKHYELRFKASAKKEWDKLIGTVKQQLHAKLAERLKNPRVESAKLHGQDQKDRYKIKLRSSGYRLVYQVYDDIVVVEVIAVGKRERGSVYENARKR